MTVPKSADKYSFALLLCLLLAGCEGYDGQATPAGKGGSVILGGFDRYCVEGVTYLKFNRGVTVMLDKDGQVVPCGK